MVEAEQPRARLQRLLKSPRGLAAADPGGMLRAALSLARDMRTGLELPCPVPAKRPANIVVAGMGGSGIGGSILAHWAAGRWDLPVLPWSDYGLPDWAGADTLVVAVSYSGNTEETLSALNEAHLRECAAVAVTSGGKMERFCMHHHLPFVKVPLAHSPRAAVALLTVPLLKLAEGLGALGIRAEIGDAVKTVAALTTALYPGAPFEKNPAARTALRLLGRYPVIYGPSFYAPVARRWRCQLNENAKMLARDDTYPEADHNDLVGLDGDPFRRRVAAVTLRDRMEPAPLHRRLEATKSVALERGVKVLEIWCDGASRLARMFHAIHLGDVASVYMAFLRGVDPSPVPVIAKLKRAIGE